MDNFSIDCVKYTLNGEDKRLGSDKKVETSNNNEINATFYIKCSNQDDNDSFILDYYGMDDMVVEKDRCEVNVYIKENKTPYDKIFTIICSHSNDNSKTIEIEITQKADNYSLRITGGAQSDGENSYTKQLKSIVTDVFNGKSDDINYNYFEECTFNISVSGGSGRYTIGNILKCREEEGQITYYDFDNGFVYNKSDDKLVIVNYGRPFIEDDYYIIRLCHKDYSDISLELKLTYSQIQSTRNASVSRKSARKKKQKQQVSEIYASNSDFAKTSDNIIENIKTIETVYEIRFDTDIENELVVTGQTDDISIPFNVFENSLPSNLMVTARANAYWCSAITDKSNRVLKLSINDFPISERKTAVTISIVDHPETYLRFIVLNKPR